MNWYGEGDGFNALRETLSKAQALLDDLDSKYSLAIAAASPTPEMAEQLLNAKRNVSFLEDQIKEKYPNEWYWM